MARLLLVALLALLALAPAATAAEPPPNAEYSEEYIPDGPAERLHADIFRPKGYDKAPVILTVSPYTGHATDGGTTPPYDPDRSGPSDRFYDFLEGSKALERGYAYVMVDLPGYGGSSGCGDWGGPREQQAVKTAVEWAAKQPWSTGKVALFGKSYDAWTGIMGLATKPAGLSAVVAMEPVYSGYRYFWTNGVRISNTFATPAAFQLYDLQPGSPSDDPDYHANQLVTMNPGCEGSETALRSADPSETSPYWEPRNLVGRSNSSIPTFLMQGFLEDNTKPDGAFDVWNGQTSPDSRAWFGQFGHWRGYERDSDGGPFKTGRDAYMAELVRFLDRHLLGQSPQRDPAVEVQSAPDGKWRAEKRWPPADAQSHTTPLKVGSYADDGEGTAGDTEGVWSFSAPLPHRAHLAGEPLFSATVSTPVAANLVVNLYEVRADNSAVLISRMAALATAGEVSLKMYGQDWVLDRGSRIGVRITDANTEWWEHAPTQQDVTVEQASITLPFLLYERSDFLSGGPSPDLENHLGSAFAVDGGLIGENEIAFMLPPALEPGPPSVCGGCTPPPGKRLTLKVKPRKRALTVSGLAPDGRVAVRVFKGRRAVASKRATVRSGRYSVRLKVRRRGTYRVTATAAGGLKASRRVRVR